MKQKRDNNLSSDNVKSIDFWTSIGSLKSDVKLTNKQLREARARFEKEWHEVDSV